MTMPGRSPCASGKWRGPRARRFAGLCAKPSCRVILRCAQRRPKREPARIIVGGGGAQESKHELQSQGGGAGINWRAMYDARAGIQARAIIRRRNNLYQRSMHAVDDIYPAHQIIVHVMRAY